MKIKKGDLVMVILGKDRGKTGKVLRVIPKKNKVMVDKINVSKKHVRPTRKNPQGGTIDLNAPMDISNVMLVCKKCNKPTRIDYLLKKNKNTKAINR